MEIAASQKSSSSGFIKALLLNRKLVLGDVLLFTIIAISIGSISILNTPSGLLFWLMRGVQVLAFFGAGWLNTFLLNKRSGFFRPFSFELSLYSFFLAAIICVALLLFYWVTDSGNLRMACASPCAFLLPFTIQQAWYFFKNIPLEQPGVSPTLTAYFVKNITPNRPVVMQKPVAAGQIQDKPIPTEITVQIQIAKKTDSSEESLFSVTAPGDMPFSKLFNSFIREQNKNNPQNIECLNDFQQPFAWEFYTKNSNSVIIRRLEPQTSVYDNHLNESLLVIAKRVKPEEATPGKFIMYVSIPPELI